MVFGTNIWRAASLFLLLRSSQLHAQECTALTNNVLTSAGCPTRCNDNPCVLYSPSQNNTCIELGASGPCYSENDFALPGASATCNITYQCLDSILWDGNQWLLALGANTATDSKTMAYVTQITELTYSSATLSVQLQGAPTGSANKSILKEIMLDQTFFDTPPPVASMFLLDVNLRNIINTVTLATTYATFYLTNVNLEAVPEQLGSFTALMKLDLSSNYIQELPPNTSSVWTGLNTVADLNLAANELTDFPVVLTKLQSLNLTGNRYTTIPENVYTMAESGVLRFLFMNSCNLTNLEVSPAQQVLLENLATFSADVAITGCRDGLSVVTLSNSNVQVCTVSTASTNGGGGSGSTVAIVLGVVGALLVLAVLGFLWYRRTYGSHSGSSKGGSTIFGTDMGSSLTGGDTMFGSSIWDDPDLLAARIEHRDIEAIKMLSRGGFGEVWLGLYMNENLVSAGKLQPSFRDSCPPSIVKLARACLSFDPAQRPSAIHISYELRKVMKDEL
ncbi:hypothetical protein CCR75_004846 [Bremia lactucae]|uniref:Protein kinase n=1 Tax=Bremia lactucae TaxID=4779 RepID=A0A976FI19_BRELC|nr:hypothetical protein CCR75_004846 [Bremia lactucae]